MYEVAGDLQALYQAAGIRFSAEYAAVMRDCLGPDLAYATPAMYGLAATTFSSRVMIAHNLVQNAIDEAKGAARVCVMANRYAGPELLERMKRHVQDEMKHSAQFWSMLDVIQAVRPEVDHSETAAGAVAQIVDFDDPLETFLCRVHSIEIRSWTMLRLYIEIIEEKNDPLLRKAIPMLANILQDEIGHVLYTGRQIDEWLRIDPTLATTLRECFTHTNRETWRDMASMSEYFAEHGRVALATKASNPPRRIEDLRD